MKGLKKRTVKRTPAQALLFGMVVGFIAFIITSLLGAAAATLLEDPMRSLGAISFTSLTLAGAAAGFITAKWKGDNGILPAFLSSLSFAMILLVAGLIMTDGRIPAVTVINILLYVCAATFFAFLARKKERKHRK